ncbi:MAG TPA: nicotinate-nucleotide--dimethylbenzimidazole phosphoribosyltransferase [Aeromicrobium sp.]|nr:nicotinate-nucleotide--dimethylbenzimidazole phosphoribosyltransferase [Aeromicrobium sp.]
MIKPPSVQAHADAADRLAALAIPGGALGQLGQTALWWASVRGDANAAPPSRVRAVVFAGDHGVAAHGVSAYPAEVTAAMVSAFVKQVAGVSVLARQHDVHVRALDLGVNADLSDFGPSVTAFKVRSGTEPIHLADAMTAEQTQQSLTAGATIANEELSAGADLLIAGDMGIGDTTIAAALIAACLGLAADEVTGRGTGIDDSTLATKTEVIATALTRTKPRHGDPVELLTALGSPDIAAQVGYLTTAAEAGCPVLLDGVVSVAAALVAERLRPGTVNWLWAGHRSTEPAQSLALADLGLIPLLDLGMRLGEGSGAVAAVPLVRSAALLLTQIARLDEIL